MERKNTLTKSWKKKIKNRISQLRLTLQREPQIVILGIGNELNGDDAAGIAIIRNLLQNDQIHTRRGLHIFDCGTVPENFSGKLRSLNPDYVLLIDAGKFSDAPCGTINLFSTEECHGFDASTHTLPLSVFGKYLETEFKCPTDMLLIQPCRTDFLSEISISVKRAVKEIADELLLLFMAESAD